MKVILDTNIVISAFLKNGGTADMLYQLILIEKHTLILSDTILEEFEEKILRKFNIPKNIVNQALETLKKDAVITNPGKATQINFQDKKDIPILVLIDQARPHYFITGDKKLLALKKQNITTFLSIREAIQALR